jgi:hypothetical protein
MTAMQSAEYAVGYHARQLHEALDHRSRCWEREALEAAIRRLRLAERAVTPRCCC